MSEKVGLAIVTYTINYGTFLQAFATQEAVRKLGYDTEIINIDSVIRDVSKSRKKYFVKQIFNFAELKSYKSTIAAIINRKLDKVYNNYYTQREKKFLEFQKKYFEKGKRCDSWNGLAEHCKNFSSVLVGSDQLWRPANIAGNFYTLNFVPEEINKVAYATSFGLKEVRKDQKEDVANFLKRIQHLSCREESGVEIIKSLTGREAKLVCDPTILLTKEKWQEFLNKNPKVEGKYILAYLLSDNKEHRDFLKKLSQKTKCKIVGVLHGAGYIKGDEKNVDEAPSDIGPFDFLNLIKNAAFVCTDSFHGCVFSVLFEKDFYAFKRFSDKDKMSTNTRVVNLLKKFDLIGRLVENYDKIDLTQIDYTVVNKKVENFREYSIKYLKEALREKI